jgi:hypothetical protein
MKTAMAPNSFLSAKYLVMAILNDENFLMMSLSVRISLMLSSDSSKLVYRRVMTSSQFCWKSEFLLV